MIYNIKGKNVTLSDKTKEKIESKLNRIQKLFPKEAVASVKISSEKLDHKVEVTLPMNKRLVRAEVVQDDLMAALDKAVDIIENQIIKHKGRIRTKIRHNNLLKDEYDLIPIADELINEEEGIVIEKNKKFELRPMDAEEAIMQMELLGHSFFVFLNVNSDTINVVYKRKNGSYGIIEPEH